jgi:hypothetical protein
MLLLVYAVGMVVLGFHPRSARDHRQPARFIATYPMVLACFLLSTGFIGWLTGAIRNTLWLVYFASLLILCGVTIAAFIRSIRRPQLSSQDPGTQSSQGLGPRSPTGQGIVGRPKSR